MIPLLQEYFRFNIQGLLYIASGIFDITVGLFVLSRDPKSPTNKAFFFITLSGFAWVISYGMMSIVRNVESVYFWLGLSYFGVPNIALSIFIFSRCLKAKYTWNRNLVSGIIFSALFMVLMNVFPSELNKIKEFRWGRFNVFRDDAYGLTFYYGIVTFFGTFLFLAAKNFLRYWRDAANPLEKRQARIIFLAFIISYFGTIDFLVTRDLNIYPVGFLALTYLIGMMAYAIVKHKVFKINVLFKKITLIAFTYSFLLAFSIPIGIWFLNRFLPNSNNDQLIFILLFATSFGLILSLGPFIYAFLVQHSYWLRGHVTTGLTHELKSPLGIIESAVAVAIDDLNQPEQNKVKMAEYLTLIQNNTTRLQNFVRDLLTVAKTSDDEVALQKEPMNLNDTIQTVCDVQKPLASQKGLNLVFEGGETCEITADPAKIRQVISNLISNAIKFSNSGTIQISLDKKDGGVICTVQDEGIGLDKKHLTKIFDRFFQARPGSKGSGIGLTIAKAWVEAHGGKIWAESEGEGGGTTMRFTLPL